MDIKKLEDERDLAVTMYQLARGKERIAWRRELEQLNARLNQARKSPVEARPDPVP